MKQLFITLSIISFQVLSAQENPTIPFLEASINIDGVMDESVWSTLQGVTNFQNHYPKDEGLAAKQTTVKMFHNGETLFVSATYADTTSDTRMASLKRDDLIGCIGNSDAFVIVLDPYNQEQSGFYFAANIKGAQVDALIERTDQSYDINTSWSAKWYVQTKVSGNNKVYEFGIPLKMIGYPEDNSKWGIQFYKRDIKANEWYTYQHVGRNYRAFDLRFNQDFEVEALTNVQNSKFTITPSITTVYQKEVLSQSDNTTFKPSLDVQYNLTSSLKLDATINPDFSQVDVDQQVTNLTRFDIFFPEQRNFFLENSDLFSGLGSYRVNPFYSRRIGAKSDIQFGLKLSGNIAPKTRIGILDVQTKEEGNESAQNYGAAIMQQQLSKNFTGLGYLISRQATTDSELGEDYNRVMGASVNYKSTNDKWTGVANYGSSFNPNITGSNDFYNVGGWYNTRPLRLEASVRKVERNYITDVGFVPRLYNYDPVNDSVIREGYLNTYGEIEMYAFPENSKKVDSYRYVFANNESNFDEEGELVQSQSLFNNALWFKSLSSVYFNIYHDYIKLDYAFDLLGNENPIPVGEYEYFSGRTGFNSVSNRKLFYNVAIGYSNAYGGDRFVNYFNIGYRMLPSARVQFTYDRNEFDLKELGRETFHLTRFTGEVFLSNFLNWTTYLQYNSQNDNFNVNSRLQWEYKPLSYVYLVLSDDYSGNLDRSNWGVALKVNYRFDI